MSDVVVRPAGPADYDAVARLTVAAYRADGQLAGGPEHGYARVLADVAGRAEVAEVLVAGAAGQVVGAVTFVLPGTPLAEMSRPGEAEFRMLAVDPAGQRRGAG